MNVLITILKNMYCRMLTRKGAVMAMLVFVLAALFLAVYMTGIQEIKGHVAIIAPDSSLTWQENHEKLKITIVDEEPPQSDLFKQKYSAFASIDGAGEIHIKTLYNEDFKISLEYLLKNPLVAVVDTDDTRGIGVNIVGFTMMLVLIFSFWNLKLFADEKEQGQLFRVAMAPVPFGGYFVAQCVYSFSMLLPQLVFLVILKVFGREIGFTILQYLSLLFLQGFLGISMAFFLYTLLDKPDNANQLGTAIITITTVLAGSFHSFQSKNTVIDRIINILPQKKIIDFAFCIQNGDHWQNINLVIYVFAFSLALLVFACFTLKKMYIKKT